jgi:hypothetical protein
MISEPKVNGLSDTNKETDYCPKKFNRFYVMLGYGQRELLEFLECGYQSGYKRKWGSPKPPQFIDRKWLRR